MVVVTFWVTGASVVVGVSMVGYSDRVMVLIPVEVVTVTCPLPLGLLPALMWKGLEYWKMLGSLSSLMTRP